MDIDRMISSDPAYPPQCGMGLMAVLWHPVRTDQRSQASFEYRCFYVLRIDASRGPGFSAASVTLSLALVHAVFPGLHLLTCPEMLLFWVASFLWVAACLSQTVQDADDTDPGMFYTGLWVPDGDPNTFNHHDTWTNQSGASVSFDFIGTQIKVFVTRRPVGTYLSKASFSIDGGTADIWQTEDPVTAISYENLIYTSKTLSPVQHRITVTNLGAIFWLDYMEYTVASAPPGGNPPSSTSTPAQTQNSSPANSATSSAKSTSSPTQSSTNGAGGNQQSSNSQTHRSSPSPTSGGSASATSGTTSASASGSTTGPGGTVGDLGSSWTAGGTWPTDTSAPATGAAGSSSSHTGMIVGVVVGVLGGLALLLSALWWLRMRNQAKRHALDSLAATPFADPSPHPSVYFSKDRPPNSPPPMTQRQMLPLPNNRYAPASDPGGYDQASYRASSVHRAHSEPADPSAAKQLALFRAHEASPHPVPYSDLSSNVVTPSAATAGHSLLRPGEIILEAIPAEHLQVPPQVGSSRVSAPSVPETMQPSVQTHSTRTAPASRSAWFARALSLSSARYEDPALASTTSPSMFTDSAYATSPVSPPSATSGSSSHRPLYFRVLRRSRDGGVRLAGGRPGSQDAQMWSPAAYDDVLEVLSESSTMPPSYAQYTHSSVSGG
ncbi:hypothetical protein C8Q73DRAFT_785702 [Cubamyces lactineus]|nr:hypothetical protein C8Q73DRAFT_785702 [Cubamyces lactineus]